MLFRAAVQFARAENWSAADTMAHVAPASCPFQIMCIVSIPASRIRAQRNDLKLSIGLVMRLIARLSCSTMLFRYLHCDVCFVVIVVAVDRRGVGAALLAGTGGMGGNGFQ
jgi:hypothetical protein